MKPLRRSFAGFRDFLTRSTEKKKETVREVEKTPNKERVEKGIRWGDGDVRLLDTLQRQTEGSTLQIRKLQSIDKPKFVITYRPIPPKLRNLTNGNVYPDGLKKASGLKAPPLPLTVAFGVTKERGMTFFVPQGEVDVDMDANILMSILRRCRGEITDLEIAVAVAEETGMGPEYIVSLLAQLEEYKVVVDYGRLYKTQQYVTRLPLPIPYEGESSLPSPCKKIVPFLNQDASPLEALLKERHSTREFSGMNLTEKELGDLAWAIYGSQSRPGSTFPTATVASAGARYPLLQHMLVRNSKDSWQIRTINQGGFAIGANVRHSEVSKIFPWSMATLEHAAVVGVISGEFERTCLKYGPRGYRYVLIEAGQAAQNAGLWCEENGIGMVEVGGFLDEELSRLIGFSYPSVAPLLALMVGK